MRTRYRNAWLLLCLVALSFPTQAQFSDPGLGGGIGFGGTFGQTQLKDGESRFFARAFLRYPLVRHLQGETGVGLGRVASQEYSTLIIPIDYRFVLSPFSFDSWNLYLYGGAGVLHYEVEQTPPQATATAKLKGWAGVIPGGIGLQFRLDDRISFETSGGYNYTLNDELNAVVANKKDAYWTYLLGLTVAGESGDADPDGDGLTNREEKQLGTNPKVADSDGDGLSDGAEVKQHSTYPLKADSDGDGLKDGEEVNTYRTDPMKADTDGDGLNDGDEVMKHKTDPMKADTDGDGLNDGDEVMKHRTDPLKADTDGDGLNDGSEVMKHQTDPLKADTDGGTVNDGAEVARGSDPLKASDDVPPKKEELKVEVGKAIVLEGIVFATGKGEITPASEFILEIAYNTLAQNPEITVEIQGHTDNTGSRATNTRLSQGRADAVKTWLVKKGIAADRVATKGFGPDKPFADNKTKDGRQKNRRIEFFRTK
ncbi:MAG: Peptidoglycan-associated outer membrane protein [Bacteroidetes bacterium]|nr:Peptidoglycan-associated outer membrane protein [Bacteroidota bacterium]